MKQQPKFKQTEVGKIPEDWEVKSFEETDIEIIDGDRGTNYPKQEEFENKGYCLFLSTKNTPDYKFDFGDSVFVTKDRDDLLRKGKLIRGDIVLTTRGTVGNIALYGEKVPFENIRINSGMVILRNKNNFNTDFLYLLLRSSIAREQFSSFATGSAQPQLPIRDINKIKLIIPSLPEQQSIASILSSLDSKIELNQRMNKTLEAIGQALFKHWFVDFEFPNEEGKPYKSSGGEMVESELGMMPKGWRVEKLGEEGTFKNGINYLRDEEGNTDFFIANVRNIANNKLILRESLDKVRIDLKKARDYLLEEKDILIARSASPGEVSLILGNKEKVIYSGFSIRYRLNNPENYLYLFLILQGLKDNLSNFSIGTTLQSVNQETLKNMKLIIPSSHTLNIFNKHIEKIIGLTYNNLKQIQDISQIRDSLLPKLMSGEIRVK